MPSSASQLNSSRKERVRTQSADLLSERLPGALLCVFVLFFLRQAYSSARYSPIWMDEILATWTIRLPSSGAIWSAIQRGADFSPPTYHLLLHAMSRITGTSYLLLRAPSIFAALFTAYCLFVYLRRYVPVAPAAFAFAWCLLGVLASYGLQVRPYAFVTACFVMALLCWDSLDLNRPNFRLATALGLLLAAATSFHFYAVLFVPLFGVMEASLTIVTRRIRWTIWTALTAAGASSLLWLPLIHQIFRYNKGDSASSLYYAKPTLKALYDAYLICFLYGDAKQMTLLLASLIALFIGIAFQHSFVVAHDVSARTEEVAVKSSNHTKLYIAALAMTFFPILIMLFARVSTGTFNMRYGLVASLGIACILAVVLSKIPVYTQVASPILVAACALALGHSSTLAEDAPGLVNLIQNAKGSDPIVIAEGLQYLQIVEAATAELRPRLFYLTAPEGSVSVDPTNEHQVERWAAIRSDLQVKPAERFYKEHSHFLLLHTEMSIDNLTGKLLSEGEIGPPIGHLGNSWLFRLQSPSQ